MKGTIYLLFLLLAICNNIYGNDVEKKMDIFKIAKNGISVPVDRFILIKRGEEYWALKFTEIKENKAKYIWYYQGDGSGDFLKKNAKKGKGKASDIYWSLIGRLAFQFGDMYIRCKNLKLDWSPNSWIYFTNTEGYDIGISMAPTKWRDIKEVNVFDKRLKWYRYDENRKKIYIKAEDLW